MIATAADSDGDGKTDITSCAELFSTLSGGTSSTPKGGSYELLPVGGTMDCSSATPRSPLGYFNGSLDGNGVTISGLNIACATGVCGLFSYLVGSAAVSDLEFDGPIVNNTGSGVGTGVLAGAIPGSGTTAGVTVSDVTITGGTIDGGDSTGSLIGWADYGVFTRINSSAVVRSTASAVGGLIGDIGAQSTYSCSSGSPSLISSSFSGSVRGLNEIGGLTGRFEPNNGSANGCVIIDSTNSGSVSSTSTGNCTVGGLVGNLWETRVESSSNSGAVTANSCTGFSMQVGGIAGRMSGDTNIAAVIDRVVNSGTVSATASGARYIGGIAGYCGGNQRSISRSYNTGAITGDQEVGGLLGWLTTGCRLTDSFSRGSATVGTNYAGGAAGTLQSTTITRTYSTTTAKFVGQNASGVCNDSFYDSQQASSISCLAGVGSSPLTGKTTADMKVESTFTAADWDFSCIGPVWAINNPINDGYPFLVGVGIGASYTPSTPPVAITRAGSGVLAIGGTDTITFELCEASTDFAVGDVTVTGGTLSGFAGSGTTYTATFTPTAGETGTASISVAAGAFSDADSNANGTSTPATLTYDTLAPGVVVARAGGGSLAVGDTDTLTFALSEASTDFSAADITVTGGTLSGFAGSGVVYTATFTPTPDTTATASVSVAAGTFTDAAGNPNLASAALSFGVDTTTTTTTTTTTSTTTTTTTSTTTTTTTTTAPSASTTSVASPPAAAPAAPVVTLIEMPSTGVALAKRSDGVEVRSEVTVESNDTVSTITIRNEDGSEITVVHEPTLIRTNFTVYRGTSLTISGDGYLPGTDIDVWLNSSPTYLGTTTTTADGTFTFEVVIPGDFELGDHVLQVEGTVLADVEQATFIGLLVLDRTEPELPATGRDTTNTVALLLVVIGLMITVSVSRRRTGSAPH